MQFIEALAFLIQVIFGLAVLVFMLRMLFQLVKADYQNPVCQMIVRFTNPVTAPLRRVVPALGPIDLPSLMIAYLLQVAKLYIISSFYGVDLGLLTMLIRGAIDLVSWLLSFYTIIIIINVVASWIVPQGMGHYNPALDLLRQLSEPLLGLVRRRMPNMGGLDLSPLIVLVILQMLSILISV